MRYLLIGTEEEISVNEVADPEEKLYD